MNAADARWRTALLLAVEKGHRDVAEVLLDAAADVNASAAKKAQSPLLCCAASGDALLVKLVLQVPSASASESVVPSSSGPGQEASSRSSGALLASGHRECSTSDQFSTLKVRSNKARYGAGRAA